MRIEHKLVRGALEWRFVAETQDDVAVLRTLEKEFFQHGALRVTDVEGTNGTPESVTLTKEE